MAWRGVDGVEVEVEDGDQVTVMILSAPHAVPTLAMSVAISSQGPSGKTPPSPTFCVLSVHFCVLSNLYGRR